MDTVTVGQGVDPLDAIAAEGSALESAAAPALNVVDAANAEAQAAAERKVQQVAVWSMIPRTLGSVLSMAMPELKAVYSDEACDLWGVAMADVAKKYGWDIDGNSPELALLVASTPFIIGTGMAVMHRRSAARVPGTAPGAAAPGRPAPKREPVDAGPPDINAGARES